MFFKNGVKNIQASGYNGARTVHVWKSSLTSTYLKNCIILEYSIVPFSSVEIFVPR